MLDYDKYAKAMEDIRNKWKIAEQLVINCDPKSVYSLSEVDILLEKHKEYMHGKESRVLSEDQKIIKKEFADTCICHKSQKQKKS